MQRLYGSLVAQLSEGRVYLAAGARLRDHDIVAVDARSASFYMLACEVARHVVCGGDAGMLPLHLHAQLRVIVYSGVRVWSCGALWFGESVAVADKNSKFTPTRTRTTCSCRWLVRWLPTVQLLRCQRRAFGTAR